MVDEHKNLQVGLCSKNTIFKLRNVPYPGPEPQANLREMIDVIKMFDKTISDCAKFQLPESPSETDVLMKHHLEYCVMKAWVYSAI
jgi:hypothetical protein